MSLNLPQLPLHPIKRHPLTGLPLQAAGVLPSGRIVWPILGGDNTVPPATQPPAAPERPDGVSEEEWAALGDPGRAALSRERDARQAAERALQASRARPTPPAKPADPPKPTDPPNPADPPKAGELDIAAIVQQAVAAAVKPFTEREEQRTIQEAADKVRTTVLDAAKARLHDATDALANVDLASLVNEQGVADETKVKAALDDLVTRKPHLAKTPERQAPFGIGGGAPAATVPEAEKVKGLLADMQRSAGVRIPGAATTN